MSVSSFLLLSLVTLRGVVTFEREGLPFYFITDDSGANWRVERRAEDPSAKVGDAITVTGEPEASSKRRLATTALRLSDVPAAPLPPPR